MGCARIYTLATPYAAADLALLKFAQSNDKLTITHPSYQPRDLQRTGDASWSLVANTFNASVAAPTGTGYNQYNYDGGVFHQAYTYAVTAVAATTFEQGYQSADITFQSNVLPGDGSRTNTITWAAVAGAVKYYCYREINGIYGYIGTAGTTSFTDDGIRPDTTNTPPTHNDPFSVSGYPAVIVYHEGRRFYANSLQKPQTIWATQSGLFYNMDTSSPARASDALTITIAAQQSDEIRWLVSLRDLLVLTSGGIWRISPASTSQVIDQTPNVKRQNATGANNVRPITIINSLLYVQEKGSAVRDLTYDLYTDGYVGDDISLLAQHLFRGRYVKEWAWEEEPSKVLWCVMSDGALLGMTYIKKEELYAWHRHDTANGFYESVVTIPEGGRDVVYFVVRRVFGGTTYRYIERAAARDDQTPANWWYVDCGISYSGTPQTTFSGLDHLNGQTVSILADGSVDPPQVVANGSITLTQPASNVTVGLPIQGQVKTLLLDPQGAAVMGKRKRIASTTLRVANTRGLKWGLATSTLQEAKPRSNENYGSPPNTYTGDIQQNIPGAWEQSGQILVQQDYPLPATICAIAPDVDVGN